MPRKFVSQIDQKILHRNALLHKLSPYGEFRAGQKDAIETMIRAYEHEEKVVQLNAPTAAGKTLDLFVLGSYLEKEYGVEKIVFTSPQVALIEKGNLFTLPKLVGKANYKCIAMHALDGASLSAADCPFSSADKGLPICMDCPYRIAKENFSAAHFGATTFARYVADPNIHRDTDVLLVDESTNIEKALLDSSTVEFMELAYNKGVPDVETDKLKKQLSSDLVGYLNRRKDQLTDEIAEVQKVYGPLSKQVWATKHPAKKDVDVVVKSRKKIDRLNSKLRACQKALRYIELQIPYVIVYDEEEKWNAEKRTREVIVVPKFKLLEARVPFGEMANGLSFMVLASGTPTTELVTNKFLSVDISHPIPKEKRQIFYTPIGSMKYSRADKNNRYNTAPKMAAEIDRLHAKFGKSTMVHCGSYQIAEMLAKSMKSKFVLQNPDDRNKSCEEFLESENKVFLSVMFEQGLDLAGPKYPLNIIAKVPFPNLGDQWIKARNDYDNWRWYSIQTAVSIMQAAGRTTRGPDDYSETYILDQDFKRFYSMNNKLLYDWFKEAIVW
jgi:Rad3-related DNA helicase